MDNLSHSLAGLAIGELLHRTLPPEENTDLGLWRRRLILFSSWLASNFPDLDLLWSRLLPPPLGYLLHHRGHTHTFFYAVVEGALIFALCWLLWPAARRLVAASSSARTGLILAITLGLVSHLAMDYLNSYGIHPFHPFNSGWYYGDLVFIIEPVFWIAFGIPVAMNIPNLPLRIAAVAALVGAPIYFTTQGYLPWASGGLLTLSALALGLLEHRKQSTRQAGGIAIGMGLALAFILLQSVASARVQSLVRHLTESRHSDAKLVDAALTSFPTNPLCWAFASINANEQAGTYYLHRGILSLAPHLMPSIQCPNLYGEEPQESHAEFTIFWETNGDLKLLRELKASNCFLEAWLRFARIPFVTAELATDLRFRSRVNRADFSALKFDDFTGQQCPHSVPAWDFPRADLLLPKSN